MKGQLEAPCGDGECVLHTHNRGRYIYRYQKGGALNLHQYLNSTRCYQQGKRTPFCSASACYNCVWSYNDLSENDNQSTNYA